jgi:hypothetical protein
VNLGPELLTKKECLASVLRFENVVAIFPQDRSHDHPDLLVVLDEQDGQDAINEDLVPEWAEKKKAHIKIENPLRDEVLRDELPAPISLAGEGKKV